MNKKNTVNKWQKKTKTGICFKKKKKKIAKKDKKWQNKKAKIG